MRGIQSGQPDQATGSFLKRFLSRFGFMKTSEAKTLPDTPSLTSHPSGPLHRMAVRKEHIKSAKIRPTSDPAEHHANTQAEDVAELPSSKRPMFSKEAKETFITTADRAQFSFFSGGIFEKFKTMLPEDQAKIKKLFTDNESTKGFHSGKLTLSDGREVMIQFETRVPNSEENYGKYVITAIQDVNRR